jgi:hypothetical protein
MTNQSEEGKKTFPLGMFLTSSISLIFAIGLGISLFRIINRMQKEEDERKAVAQTYAICSKTAKEFVKSNKDDNEFYLDPQVIEQRDVWGHNLKHVREITENCAYYMVISAGLDGEFETDDDIGAVQTDYNKSRIAGKWLGSRAIEGIKGFKEGLKQKSKFDSQKIKIVPAETGENSENPDSK